MENDLSDKFPVSEIRKAIGEAEERLGVNYAETQVAAIEKALHSPVDDFDRRTRNREDDCHPWLSGSVC